MQTITIEVQAASYGAERFKTTAFDGQIGKTIPVADAVNGQSTHGILKAAEVAPGGRTARLTFEVAHHGESMLGREAFELKETPSFGFTMVEQTMNDDGERDFSDIDPTKVEWRHR